jgi:hypothetical protein
MGQFEIGLIYKKSGRLHIAVDPDTLVSCKNGKASKIKPTSKYEVVRSISVEALTESWGITLDAFDKLVGAYLGPPEGCVKARPRGTRRTTQTEEDYWKRSRTGRIARPRL